MIFIIIAAAVFFLDYAVKGYVEKHKKEGMQESALGGRLLIRRMSNYGTAGSYLKDRPQLIKWGSAAVLLALAVELCA